MLFVYLQSLQQLILKHIESSPELTVELRQILQSRNLEQSAEPESLPTLAFVFESFNYPSTDNETLNFSNFKSIVIKWIHGFCHRLNIYFEISKDHIEILLKTYILTSLSQYITNRCVSGEQELLLRELSGRLLGYLHHADLFDGRVLSSALRAHGLPQLLQLHRLCLLPLRIPLQVHLPLPLPQELLPLRLSPDRHVPLHRLSRLLRYVNCHWILAKSSEL